MRQDVFFQYRMMLGWFANAMAKQQYDCIFVQDKRKCLGILMIIKSFRTLREGEKEFPLLETQFLCIKRCTWISHCRPS